MVRAQGWIAHASSPRFDSAVAKIEEAEAKSAKIKAAEFAEAAKNVALKEEAARIQCLRAFDVDARAKRAKHDGGGEPIPERRHSTGTVQGHCLASAVPPARSSAQL